MKEIILHRRDRPNMVFARHDNEFIHTSRHGNKYRLFIEIVGQYCDVWIGRHFKMADGKHTWATWERELRADYFMFGRVKIQFMTK